MAAVSTVVAAAAVAVAAGSAYAAHQQQAAAADDQKDAAKVASNESKAQAAAQRRQQIREERVKRASIIQSAQNSGVSASSGSLGAQSVLDTQSGITMSNISRSTASSDAIGDFQQSAADHLQSANNYQQIGSVASSIFGVAAPYAGNSLFGTKTKPADVGTTNSSKGIFGS